MTVSSTCMVPGFKIHRNINKDYNMLHTIFTLCVHVQPC